MAEPTAAPKELGRIISALALSERKAQAVAELTLNVVDAPADEKTFLLKLITRTLDKALSEASVDVKDAGEIVGKYITSSADTAKIFAERIQSALLAPGVSQNICTNVKTGHRTHSCNSLRVAHVGQTVTLSGWVQKIRDVKNAVFIDLRDRYGITQIALPKDKTPELVKQAQEFGREWVIKVVGVVIERPNKNKKRPTGNIEVNPTSITVLNKSQTPPFLIEDKTDGLETLRMKYRFIDIRRDPIKNALIYRHNLAQIVRRFLTAEGFIEVETPTLIKSTPEGARDFVVPSRREAGKFYALPQSPQTFKQLLMVAGIDKYFQLVKCFRDEELRADRQPEFTQIDCEMSFVEQEDILAVFEGFMRTVFRQLKGIELPPFPRISFEEAMTKYGSDKPDTRFEMYLKNLNDVVKDKGFSVFDNAEIVTGFCAKKAVAKWGSKKKLQKLSKYATSDAIGAKGLVWIKYEANGKTKSSGIDKFFSCEQQLEWMKLFNAEPGDMLFIFAGNRLPTLEACGKFRVYIGGELGLRTKDVFNFLWVVEWPLLEWDEDEKRFTAMHHPFTAPYEEDLALLETDPGKVRAIAHDMVCNGVEIGGGSIRIHDTDLQRKVLTLLGFSKEDAEEQFGFLMESFTRGAPPHGGLAFGFDRLCSVLNNSETIRDYIAFPKNNQGRDVMIEAPGPVSGEQLKELHLDVVKKQEPTE